MAAILNFSKCSTVGQGHLADWSTKTNHKKAFSEISLLDQNIGFGNRTITRSNLLVPTKRPSLKEQEAHGPHRLPE
jgi:hypothetical protein